VAVADSIVARIDRDRDGLVSSAEQQAYATAVVPALHIELDADPLVLRLTAATFFAVPAAAGLARLTTRRLPRTPRRLVGRPSPAAR
jgi:hypothetical protein